MWSAQTVSICSISHQKNTKSTVLHNKMIQDENILNEDCPEMFYRENRDDRIPSFIYNSPRKKNKSRAINFKNLHRPVSPLNLHRPVPPLNLHRPVPPLILYRPLSPLKGSSEVISVKVENISITSPSVNIENSSSVLSDISLETVNDSTTPTEQVMTEKELLFAPESPITSWVTDNPHCHSSSLGACTLLPHTSLLIPCKTNLIGLPEYFKNEGDVSDDIPDLTLAVENLSVDQQDNNGDADDDVISPVIPYLLINNALPIEVEKEAQRKEDYAEDNVLVLSDKRKVEKSKDALNSISEDFHLEDKISKIIDTLNDTFTITKGNQKKKQKLKYSSKKGQRVCRNMALSKAEVQNNIPVSESETSNSKVSKKVSFTELKRQKKSMHSRNMRNQECHQKLQMTIEKEPASSLQLSRKIQPKFIDSTAKSSLSETNMNQLETQMTESKPNELHNLRRTLRPRIPKNDEKVDIKTHPNSTTAKDIHSSKYAQKKSDKKHKVSDILVPNKNNDEEGSQNIDCTLKEKKSFETCQDLEQLSKKSISHFEKITPPLSRMTRSKTQTVKNIPNKISLIDNAKNVVEPKTKIASSVSGSKLDTIKSVLEQRVLSSKDTEKSIGVEELSEKKLLSRKLRKRKLVDQEFLKQKELADQIVSTDSNKSTAPKRVNNKKSAKTGPVIRAKKINTQLPSEDRDNATGSVVREKSFERPSSRTKKTKLSSLPNNEEPKQMNSNTVMQSSRKKQKANKEISDQNEAKVKSNNLTKTKPVRLSTLGQNNEGNQPVVTNTRQLRKKKQDLNKESASQDKINPQPLASEESVKLNKPRGRNKKNTSKMKVSLSIPKALDKIRKLGENLSHKYVGVHCSIAGGFSNAVSEAAKYGARSFGLFLRNGRNWKLNAVDEKEVEKFKKACMEYNYIPNHILPHGSYLMNCGSSSREILRKSRETLIHELKICEKLGLTLYTFHPGSACHGNTVDECIQTIADSINMAHKEIKHVKTVIENMSGQGKTIGGKLEELKAIINLVQDKSRIGVCLDSCHAYAAGFNLATKKGYEHFMQNFEDIIGLEYLSAVHLNDAKEKLGSNLDRHQNIGRGHIGLEGFRYIMNDPRFNELPMILETPLTDYAEEVKILYELESV